MIYALVCYPGIDNQKINLFRKKYDPQFELIQTHITLMFPVPESVGESFLVDQIGGVLKYLKPFPIHLKGIEKSSDNYLYLLVQEGSANIIDLHKKIYESRLTDYLKKDMPFVPHITLGRSTDKNSEALEEAKRLDLDFQCVVDKLHLIKVNDDGSQIVWNREFSLM